MRSRRTKSEMQAIRSALYRLVEENQPVTVRGAYYLAVSAGIVAKTEGEYQSTVVGS